MWQTRTLATFIAASVPTESDDNPLLDAAAQIGIEPDEAADERAAEPLAPIGSYEALVNMFSNPSAWRSN